MSDRSCQCGGKVHRHGSRRHTLIDYKAGLFGETSSRVQRFKCATCKRTLAEEEPSSIPGFRMTPIAAERLVELALVEDMQTCADLSGVDRSTISRFLQTAAFEEIASTGPIAICRLELLRASTIALQNPKTGVTLGYVGSSDVDALKALLHHLKVKVIQPCPQLAARVLHWGDEFVISLAKPDFKAMLVSLFQRAARKFVAAFRPNDPAPTAVANLLSADVSTLLPADAEQLGKIAAPGTTARGFMRMRERLFAVYDAPDITSARLSLQEWIADCGKGWNSILNGVLQFLDTYQAAILSHTAALTHVIRPSPAHELKPASIMTLALSRQYGPTLSFKGPSLTP